MTIICPFCGGALSIYREPVIDWEWFNCSVCHANGDLIKLASLMWKLDIPTTIRKLSAAGVPLFNAEDRQQYIVDEYVNLISDVRERTHKFWKAAQESYVQDSLERHKLNEQLHITPPIGVQSRWYASMSKYVGLGRPNGLSRPNGKLTKNRSLFLAAHGLPGMISGFWQLGCTADKRPYYADFRYMPPGRTKPSRKGTEAGLAFYDTVIAPHVDFGNTAFAFADPGLVLRLQACYLRDNDGYLPLVLYYNDTTRYPHVWNNLPKKHWVFWEADLSHKVFRQAIAANGSVSDHDAIDHDKISWCSSWLHELNKCALPWPQALDKHLEKCSDGEAEGLLRALNMPEYAKGKFLDSCHEHSRRRYTRLGKNNWAARTIKVNQYIIVERNNQWIDGEGTSICNYTFKINEEYRDQNENTWYAGCLIYKNKTVHFDLPVRSKYSSAFKFFMFVEQIALKAGLPPFCIHPGWGRNILDIAKAFNPPKNGGVKKRPDRISEAVSYGLDTITRTANEDYSSKL